MTDSEINLVLSNADMNNPALVAYEEYGKWDITFDNPDDLEQQKQIRQCLTEAVSIYQTMKAQESQTRSDVDYSKAQVDSLSGSLDNMYRMDKDIATNSEMMNKRFEQVDKAKADTVKSLATHILISTLLVVSVQEHIAYLKSLISPANKVNPAYIPFNPKLESNDFNKIAHFRVLEPFHDTLKNYLKPDASILRFKSELFYAAIDSDKSFKFTMLPLFIQSISYGSVDKVQIFPLIGDYFNTQFFGRMEQVITIEALLLDTPETKAFATITMLYMDFFRLTHVSRVGVPLTLEIGDKLFTGAFTSMNINKSSMNEDLLQVTFEFLVLEYTAFTEYNRLPINNIHTVTW